ncbi:D-beta-hydroxybutyrate dehydrogenase, mitochondrial isoform X2 [Lingula anatina]|uniref:D-beta-hydroxybutyrate dehydrogenase, mitochondrial isoform X2 n=1 Tax=Lingula anatina TaxID=7574 RepID=A0A1S3HXE2_LINAN|nr:D-beta-hydroxybutyrate dehydrogenase, mitochondrial isoform X2 [Lingula anatina]|eukprot:XP_013390702.1 D-beta-hydroxybutyrate dehydrogenase, mitochondrial isoform X2 [Lingula anatina]
MLWTSTVAAGMIFFSVGVAFTVLTIYLPWVPLATSTGLTMWGVCLLFTECMRQRDRMPVTGRVVLVTGCDTGCLDSAGKGAETLRTTCSSNLHVVQLDVTNDEQIDEVFCMIKNNCKELWGVVNNAGIGCWGAVEIVSMEWIQRTMDINTYGVVRVCKKFLPLIRISRGRIVNISSVRGLSSRALNSGYCMSKFALETLSDSLRREMKRFGVHVSVVEPANFSLATEGGAPEKLDIPLRADWDTITGELKSVYPREEYVEQYLANSIKNKEMCGAKKDTTPINEAVLDGLFSRQPCCRYLIGGTDKIMDIGKVYVFLNWFLPCRTMDRILEGDSPHRVISKK